MSDIWKKIGFVVGAIALLLVLMYSTVVFIPKIIALFTNIESPFESKVGKIEVNVDQNNLENGEIFLLTWKDSDKEQSLNYYFKYSCETNLNLQTRDASGVKTLVCDSPIKLNSSEGVIPLLPSLDVENSFRDVTLTVYASEINKEDVVNSGEIIVTVKNTSLNSNQDKNTEDNATITTKPDSTSNTTSNSYFPTYTNTTSNNNTYYTNPSTGYADLAIVNAYYSNTVIMMTVRNLGNATTPTWYFSYSVPGDGIKYSPIQPALVPGSGVLVAIAFSNAPKGTVAITLDPNNAVIESNNYNNSTFVDYPGSPDYGRYYYHDYYYYDRDDRDDRGNDDADLDIIDTAVGRISGGRFVEDDEIDDNDIMAIRFVVENIGDESTGSWRYEVEEPRDGNHTYRSSRQNSLRPGERRTIYVEFDDLDEGDYRLEIEVDSDDDVDEERENNNTATVRIEVRD